MGDYWKLDGHTPVKVADVIEWAKSFEASDRHVAITEAGEARVSTVFLGIDHSFGAPTPLLFESIVFGGPHDQEQRRYATWDEAERGHAELVTMIRGAFDPAPTDPATDHP